MGLLNSVENRAFLSKSIVDSICPFCGNKFNDNYKFGFEEDSFEYICMNCNPAVTISLSRCVASEIDVLLNRSPYSKEDYIQIIKNSKTSPIRFSINNF